MSKFLIIEGTIFAMAAIEHIAVKSTFKGDKFAIIEVHLFSGKMVELHTETVEQQTIIYNYIVKQLTEK